MVFSKFSELLLRHLSRASLSAYHYRAYTSSVLLNSINNRTHNQNGSAAVLWPHNQSVRQRYEWISFREYSKDTTVAGVDENLNPKGLEKKKLAPKKVQPEKILLVSENEQITQVTLVDAEKIAKKKGVQLCLDTTTQQRLKSDKKVYRLETNAAHFRSNDAAQGRNDKKKDCKTMIIKSKITEHDVLAKVKQIIKNVEKGHPVQVFIGQAGSGDSESVFKIMEANLKASCKIQQKISKGSEIRFKVILCKDAAPAVGPQDAHSTTNTAAESESNSESVR